MSQTDVPTPAAGLGFPAEDVVAGLLRGAALMNLRIAIMMAGREPRVTLLPDPGKPLLLATLRLAGPYRPTDADRELHAAIAARHTNRRPFSNRPVPSRMLAELAS